MVAGSTFLLQEGQGWQRGFANLFAKENRAWWGTRRWLIQLILWPLVIDGLVAFMILVAATQAMAGQADAKAYAGLFGLQGLFDVGATALAIGVVLLAQDQIVGERLSGVTEWILSKPASRPAYLLAKMAADVIGVIALLIALPVAIAYGMISLAGAPPPLGLYLLGVAGLALHTLFYLCLTLLMGVLTTNRGKLLGVPLGVLFLGTFATRVPLLHTVAQFTPWGLGSILTTTAIGATPLATTLASMLVTAALSVACLAVMLSKFRRMEF